MSQMEKIGALWLKKSAKGTMFMSGLVGGKSVIIFKNSHKEAGDKKPDYEVFKGRDREQPPEREPGDEAEIPF